MKRKASRGRAADRSEPDAVTDVLWSALVRTEPRVGARKKAVVFLLLVALLASWLNERLDSRTPPSATPPSSSSISQEGGVHIGDNVIGGQTVIEAADGSAR